MKYLVLTMVVILGSHPSPAADSAQPISSSKDEKYLNVLIAPLGFLGSWYNLDVDIRLANHWSVGPTFTYRGSSDTDYYSYFGIRGNYSFTANPLFAQIPHPSDYYISAIARHESYWSRGSSNVPYNLTVGFDYLLLGGYRIYSMSRLNYKFGVGFVYTLATLWCRGEN